MAGPFEQLDAALLARGFAVTYAVRVEQSERPEPDNRLVGPLRKWLGRRRVQPSWSIAGSHVVDCVDRQQAERTVAHLGQYQSLTPSIEVSDAWLYAWDPEHPQRGDQPIERIRVAGLGFAIERGRLGDFASQPLTRVTDLAPLIAAVDERRETWTTAGLRESNTQMDPRALQRPRSGLRAAAVRQRRRRASPRSHRLRRLAAGPG